MTSPLQMRVYNSDGKPLFINPVQVVPRIGEYIVVKAQTYIVKRITYNYMEVGHSVVALAIVDVELSKND